MRLVTIIQARMGSTRLPGKVILDLDGKTVLARVVERVQRSQLKGDVVVATTTKVADDRIVKECRRLGVQVFRGSEDDVLDRYYQAAVKSSADAIVRICSDCPLIDPEILDKTLREFLNSSADYASNAVDRTYPRGLDVEAMTFDALERCYRRARLFYQRSHVTPYIYENPELFNIVQVTGGGDRGHHRWTLDTPEDYAFMRAIYERMPDNGSFSWHDVLQLLDREPALADLNRHISQKVLQAG